jgi:hypothetical protein
MLSLPFIIGKWEITTKSPLEDKGRLRQRFAKGDDMRKCNLTSATLSCIPYPSSTSSLIALLSTIPPRESGALPFLPSLISYVRL